MAVTYFVGQGIGTKSRHQSIGSAVRGINTRIAAGETNVPVWQWSTYGPPTVTVNEPITPLKLAGLIKAARKENK